ncbi:hypothetical protein DC498_11515 [Terrimonas sp.]|nr:hypothetical protein DC498_11515 [Terrimonas sp.]
MLFTHRSPGSKVFHFANLSPLLSLRETYFLNQIITLKTRVKISPASYALFIQGLLFISRYLFF